jgi:hypothetical protein
MVKEVVPVIRSEYPEARIMLGSPGKFDRGFFGVCLEEGIGKLIDVFAWHPFYQVDPNDPTFRSYVADVKAFKALAESYGFRGEYMGVEWLWSSPYPSTIGSILEQGQGPYWRLLWVSEIVKAKYLTRLMITHAALDMASFWNETWQDQLTHWDIGLFRNTFAADPLNSTQPQPAYYALRTLSTVFDETHPAEYPVEVQNDGTVCEIYTFTLPDDTRLVALWVPGISHDDSLDVPSDIILPGIRCKGVTGIDILNGFEQELSFSVEGENTILKGLLIKDYPLVLKATPAGK